jgi:hypothetical protein
MDVQPDFRELLAWLNARQVEYVVVGAFALAFHGAPRFTGDLDILVRPHPANAMRLIQALSDFGFHFPNLTVEDFLSPTKVVQRGLG